MIRPGPRLPGGLLVVAALALSVPLIPQMAALVVVAALALLIVAVVEARLLGRVEIAARREPHVALSIGQPEAVSLQLRSTAAVPLRATLRQVWPSLLDSAHSVRELILAPQPASADIALDVRGAFRGVELLEPARVAITRWGWAERIIEATPAGQLSVIPDVLAVRRLSHQLDSAMLRGLGSRISPRHGKGRELDRLRDYVAGDDPRDIAWKASARHGKLITREYRLERSQDVLACVDSGHRMGARAGRLSRLDHAVNAAVMLAWLCHRAEDRFGMLSFANEVGEALPPGRGGHHLGQAVRLGTRVEAQPLHTDYVALAADLVRRLRRRTLVLITTSLPQGDEQAPLVRACKLLIPDHLPLILVLRDPMLDVTATASPRTSEELARTLVARDVRHRQQQAMSELRQAGALVVETAPEDAGLSAVNAYLDVKRRQIL